MCTGWRGMEWTGLGALLVCEGIASFGQPLLPLHVSARICVCHWFGVRIGCSDLLQEASGGWRVELKMFKLVDSMLVLVGIAVVFSVRILLFMPCASLGLSLQKQLVT